MINVLHLRDTERVCGPGKTIIETACAANRSEFHLSVGLFSAEGRPTDYIDAVRARGIEVHQLPAGYGWDPRLVRKLVNLVRERRVHIIHSHDYLSDILTRIVRAQVPVRTMSTVHGWITNTFRSKIYVKLAQRALRGLDRVVAVSAETRARILAAGVPRERVVVIHNAIVAKNYRTAMFERGALRRQLGIAPSAVLVGSIGRLSPEKGQRDFLTAVARLAHREPKLHALLAGDGPDRSALMSAAAELGIADRVSFVGHLKDVRPVYRDLDVLALTSYTEGFPNVILEALCMDVPVLATDVGGVGEVVFDQETGVLVPAGDVDRIERGLRQLIDNREWATRLASAGKALVMDNFEFQQRTAKEEAVYRELSLGV